MKEFRYVIGIKNGLHARPAGMLVNLAKTFESEIKLFANGKEANCKRILSVMALGVKCGTEMCFQISGIDEEKAENALTQHCKENLSNGE